MPRKEIEGDFVMGWADRKRATLVAGKDPEGRVINGRAPILELEGLVTPTDAFYVVNQLEVPDPIHPDDWQLAIGGLVERPVTLSFADLRKLPGRTIRAVAECAGNDAGFFDYQRKGSRKPSRMNQQDMQKRAAQRVKGAALTEEEVSSESTTTCAMSAGEFTGVSLVDVLKKAGVRPEAAWMRAEGFDTGRPDPAVQYRSVGTLDYKFHDPGVIHFDKGLPIAKALDPDTLLAWSMNGEYLTHIHGGPVRLITPGWSGNWWVKWVQQLELTATMPQCYHQTHYFVGGKGADDPDKYVMTAMGVRCLILDPIDEDSPLPRGEHVVRGLAWSGMGAIDRVEVSLDDGATWTDAHVELPRERFLWRRWSFLWNADRPGSFRILARATDETGRVQPQVPWNFQRKCFDGIVPTEVTIV
jgi:DMSO/TMAO reductase YedYZ molybdopterin-dependent catalytic subunit